MRMHIGHVAMRVTDLRKSVDHARRTLGLRETWRSDTEVHLSANEKHHELQFIASGKAGLDHVGLEIEDVDDLHDMRDRIIASGAKILTEKIDEEGIDQGLRCAGPGGIVFEVYTGMSRALLTPKLVTGPLARRLGHVTLFVEEKAELQRFLLDVLDFRISDKVGDLQTWLRCDDDHHGIAIGQSVKGDRMHHYAFEVESIGAIAHYADHISQDGQRFLWGPGRHGPGFNIYTYLFDPEEAVVEVYTDLLKIRDEAAYKAIDWSTEPRAMNLWGPSHPERFEELGIPTLSQ